jgi:hypothetical protein
LFESNSISQRFGRNQEGGESGSVTITETKFSVGLAQVKAETISESGRVSWVRLGPGWVTGLRIFSLSRGDQVSRVRSGYGSGNRVSTG